jgi:hypothetical protein
MIVFFLKKYRTLHAVFCPTTVITLGQLELNTADWSQYNDVQWTIIRRSQRENNAKNKASFRTAANEEDTEIRRNDVCSFLKLTCSQFSRRQRAT